MTGRSINPILLSIKSVRGRLLNLLGDSYDPGLGAFGRGAEVQDPGAYPSREQINEASREVNARLFAKLLSGLVFCLGFLLAAFTARKQALHDLLAGTLVVR